MPAPRKPMALAAYTIPEFCKAYRLSRSQYYTMKLAGIGPVEMRVGGRKRLISFEAAAEWQRQREGKAARS